MKTGYNRTIEDRLEDIEKEVHQVKLMLTEFLSRHSNSNEGDANTFMNVKDVARFLKVEAAVVYSACNKGEIPFLKVGKLYKFKKADVLKWLKNDKNKVVFDADEYVNKYLPEYSLVTKA